eukprot:5957546-Prymnesium_polylepis.1
MPNRLLLRPVSRTHRPPSPQRAGTSPRVQSVSVECRCPLAAPALGALSVDKSPFSTLFLLKTPCVCHISRLHSPPLANIWSPRKTGSWASDTCSTHLRSKREHLFRQHFRYTRTDFALGRYPQEVLAQ